MIKIGIISAMQEELYYLQKNIKSKLLFSKANYNFFSGNFKKFEIILLKCGIGKVSSAIGTTILINNFNPEFIINIGNAGALSSKLKIGDIVISKKNSYHDFDITKFGYKYGQVPSCPFSFISDINLIKIALQSLKKTNLFGVVGEICTGDTFINSTKKINFIKKFFPKAIAVEMEGASIAHVCYKFNIPFISLRLISDLANKNSIHDFKKFLIKKNNQIIILIKKILKNL